jgi:hypothetical protein
MFNKRVLASIVTISVLMLLSVVGSNLFSLGPKTAAAQDVSVVIEGPLQSVTNNTWVVNGVTIEIDTTTTITGTPLVGSTVRVVAVQRTDGKLTAHSVTITVTIGSTPTATPTSAASSETTETATPTATGMPIQYVKVVIEGPVEQVDLSVDVVVVYKQRIRMRHDDPIRTKIKIGDWVHVDGNLERENINSLIIVVINIIIINPPPVIIVVQPGNNNPPPSKGMGMGMGDDDD